MIRFREDGKTNCMTEQGTKIMVPDKVARLIAKDGVYDPFLPDQAEEIAKSKTSDKQVPAADPVRGIPPANAEGSARPSVESGLHANYVAPADLPPMQATAGYVAPKQG